jgi:acyl dehydratase
VTVQLVFKSAGELAAAVGVSVGPTEWVTIEQNRIYAFADATGDHQWIHVDIERAKQGPFGTTIAHGYLTLSLASLFLPQLIEVRGAALGLNYGCDRVRFPAAVRVGSRVRGSAEILGAEELPGRDGAPSGIQVKIRVTVELEGGDKPACVADTLSRWYFNES